MRRCVEKIFPTSTPPYAGVATAGATRPTIRNVTHSTELLVRILSLWRGDAERLEGKLAEAEPLCLEASERLSNPYTCERISVAFVMMSCDRPMQESDAKQVWFD